jgi:hypothetical protein
MKRVVGMLIITKKKVVREGVDQQNISSSDQSDESEDDAGTSDASDTITDFDSQIDLVEGVSSLAVTQRCDCKSKCKTRRYPCVLANKATVMPCVIQTIQHATNNLFD